MAPDARPKCPVCGRKGKPAGALYRCDFGHIFDDTPNEGGDFHDSDPSRRLELQEEAALARRHNAERRSQASKGFRF